jgi:hypothetical protein
MSQKLKRPSKPGYAVGYGKPPLSTRFKPGTSGNAKGRPKNSKNLKTLIRQALTAKISIREGSSNRRVSKIEGVVLRQLENALKGEDRAAMAVIKMAMQMGFLEDAQPEVAETVTSSDEEILQQLMGLQNRRR